MAAPEERSQVLVRVSSHASVAGRFRSFVGGGEGGFFAQSLAEQASGLTGVSSQEHGVLPALNVPCEQPNQSWLVYIS